MTVVSAIFKNYKILKDFSVTPGSKSFFVVGDSEFGKSTFIEGLASTLMLVPFDQNPLSEGAEAGFIEVKHDFGDGHIYTVKRRFSKKNVMRFEVFDENGGEHKSLKGLLERLLGKGFIVNHFDHRKYFYECTTTDQRTEYAVKKIGGEQVLLNMASIKTKTTERHQVGSERSTFETLIERSILDPETLEEDVVKYAEPRTLDYLSEYEPLKNLLSELKDKDALQADYVAVKENNDKHSEKTARNADIDAEIVILQQCIKNLREEKKDNAKWLANFPPDIDFQKVLELELQQVEEHNERLAPLIAIATADGKQEIVTFNKNQVEFQHAIGYYERWNELDGKWEQLDLSIRTLKEKNKEIFKQRLPLPELSFEDGVILYKCDDGVNRELCFPNISTGRSIRVAAQIQRVLNPKGNNLVVISEGQSLGSKLDDVIAECNEFGVQYIVEITERNSKLSIKLEEEYLKKEPQPINRKNASRDDDRAIYIHGE